MTASNLDFAFSFRRNSANSWAFRVSRENDHRITVSNFQPLLRVPPMASRRQVHAAVFDALGGVRWNCRVVVKPHRRAQGVSYTPNKQKNRNFARWE